MIFIEFENFLQGDFRCLSIIGDSDLFILNDSHEFNSLYDKMGFIILEFSIKQ